MNISNVIQLASAIIIGFGVIVALKQLKDQHEWYRREKALSYSNLYYPELQKTKILLEENFDIISRNDPIPIKEIKDKIEKNKELKIQLNYLLAYYENVGIACFNKIADEDVLFDLMVGTLISFRNKLRNYIDFRREEARNSRLWENFEKLSIKWENKMKGPITKRRPTGAFKKRK